MDLEHTHIYLYICTWCRDRDALSQGTLISPTHNICHWHIPAHTVKNTHVLYVYCHAWNNNYKRGAPTAALLHASILWCVYGYLQESQKRRKEVKGKKWTSWAIAAIVLLCQWTSWAIAVIVLLLLLVDSTWWSIAHRHASSWGSSMLKYHYSREDWSQLRLAPEAFSLQA